MNYYSKRNQIIQILKVLVVFVMCLPIQKIDTNSLLEQQPQFSLVILLDTKVIKSLILKLIPFQYQEMFCFMKISFLFSLLISLLPQLIFSLLLYFLFLFLIHHHLLLPFLILLLKFYLITVMSQLNQILLFLLMETGLRGTLVNQIIWLIITAILYATSLMTVVILAIPCKRYLITLS